MFVRQRQNDICLYLYGVRIPVVFPERAVCSGCGPAARGQRQERWQYRAAHPVDGPDSSAVRQAVEPA